MLETIKHSAQNAYHGVKNFVKQARKGQFAGVNQLVPLALAIVSLAIVVGVGAIVLNEMDNTTDDSDASSVLSTGVTALQDFADFFTVIVIIGIAAVIFLLLRVVRGAGQGKKTA